ncbi:MAG TPA: NAD kinase [Bacilli bacterium]
MNYSIVSRGDSVSESVGEQFRRAAGARGMNEQTEKPDVVVSIGGDGTMLKAFHQYSEKLASLAFVGVHTGHLGFFADWRADEVEQLVEMMAENDLLEKRIVRYPLVEVTVDYGTTVKTYHALNEFTLKGVGSMFVAGIHINDELFEMFRGDGICISSPIGSTAYNKSLGGAVIHPALESLQIAEIASINNRLFRTLGSPIILPNHHHCDIKPNPEHSIQLNVDHLQIGSERVKSIRCKVAEQKVAFARFRPLPFWTRVREAFIGNGH